MKKILSAIILTTALANAETIILPTPINVGATIESIDVGGAQYKPDDNSWVIYASPNVTHAQPANGNGVVADILIRVRMEIKVLRSEIEAHLQIADVGTATVDQLNDAVRAVAMSKALAALQPE